MKSRRFTTNLAAAATASFLLGALSVSCGSSTSGGTGFGAGSSNGGASGTASSGSGLGGSASTFSSGMGGEIGFDVQTADYSAEAFYENDPPPKTCDGGGVPPPPPGGTPECPDDKNLPGCICAVPGMTAPCWTGLRADRDHGDCKDGTTTCVMNSESTSAWGPCKDEVLPLAGATGKAACECFSTGHWQIDNLSPCFITDGMGTVTQSVATDATTMMCPTTFMAPTNWSTDSITVDCAGTFTLCYTIKAGNPKSPQPTDCVMAKVCVTADYPGPDDAGTDPVLQLPDLPGWSTDATQTACAQQFYTSGGYGQMSVNGQSSECEMVDKVFQTVTYCASSCTPGSTAPGCAGCQPGGGGSF